MNKLNGPMGVSSTQTPGQFAYEKYFSRACECDMIQWDYRDSRGVLHSGVARSIEEAKRLAAKKSGEKIA